MAEFPAHSADDAAVSAIHVLYAEDDLLIADLTSRYLKRSGYVVTHRGDGTLAYEEFLKHPDMFRILFTDHEMPSLNGLALIRAVRAKGFVGPILVNSGSLTPEIQRAYETVGVSRFVPKPALPSQLLEAFRAVS